MKNAYEVHVNELALNCTQLWVVLKL